MTNKTNPTDAILTQFGELMVERMEEMQASDWKKGWFDVQYADLPRNLSGRAYSNSNSFILNLYTTQKGWKMPVFMTFNQAHDAGALIKKNEKSFPVVYWNLQIKDFNGKPLTIEEYNSLSKGEKLTCDVRPFLKYYRVFNIDQTTLKEVNPEMYDKLADGYKSAEIKDASGMYVNEAIDRMVEKNEWVCPIAATSSNRAYYSPGRDSINIPLKQQFRKDGEELYASGQEYYATMLHEMAHSTGAKSRLNRFEDARFGNEKYAKEELVAEMTAAFVGSTMGFSSKITDNNAAYMKGWCECLRSEPKFVMSVLASVDKAAKMVFEEVNKQRLALGQDMYQAVAKDLPRDTKLSVAQSAMVKSNRQGILVIEVPGYKDRMLTKTESDLWNKFNGDNDRKALLNQFVKETITSGEKLQVPHRRTERMSNTLKI